MEKEEHAAAPRPKRGRPRKDDADRAARRAEIMNAAVHLFSQQSYHETTMSDIARAVGLNQSSLYYWFKDKEDLLHAILQENETSLRCASMIAAHSGESVLRLHAIAYSDTLMMCGFPFDYYELEEVALAYPDRFEEFFSTYRTLRTIIEGVVAQGMEEGAFPEFADPSEATTAILALTEGLQHQYHQASTTALDIKTGVWGSLSSLRPDALAKLAADGAIEALTHGLMDVGVLHAEAAAKGWIAPTDDMPASDSPEHPQ